jgi:hypothetical protein
MKFVIILTMFFKIQISGDIHTLHVLIDDILDVTVLLYFTGQCTTVRVHTPR